MEEEEEVENKEESFNKEKNNFNIELVGMKSDEVYGLLDKRVPIVPSVAMRAVMLWNGFIGKLNTSGFNTEAGSTHSDKLHSLLVKDTQYFLSDKLYKAIPYKGGSDSTKLDGELAAGGAVVEFRDMARVRSLEQYLGDMVEKYSIRNKDKYGPHSGLNLSAGEDEPPQLIGEKTYGVLTQNEQNMVTIDVNDFMSQKRADSPVDLISSYNYDDELKSPTFSIVAYIASWASASSGDVTFFDVSEIKTFIKTKYDQLNHYDMPSILPRTYKVEQTYGWDTVEIGFEFVKVAWTTIASGDTGPPFEPTGTLNVTGRDYNHEHFSEYDMLTYFGITLIDHKPANRLQAEIYNEWYNKKHGSLAHADKTNVVEFYYSEGDSLEDETDIKTMYPCGRDYAEEIAAEVESKINSNVEFFKSSTAISMSSTINGDDIVSGTVMPHVWNVRDHSGSKTKIASARSFEEYSYELKQKVKFSVFDAGEVVGKANYNKEDGDLNSEIPSPSGYALTDDSSSHTSGPYAINYCHYSDTVKLVSACKHMVALHNGTGGEARYSWGESFGDISEIFETPGKPFRSLVHGNNDDTVVRPNNETEYYLDDLYYRYIMRNAAFVESNYINGSEVSADGGSTCTLGMPLVKIPKAKVLALVTVGDVYWNHRFEGEDAGVVDCSVVKLEPLMLDESPIIARGLDIDNATLYGMFFNSLYKDNEYGTIDLSEILTFTKEVQEEEKSCAGTEAEGKTFVDSSFKYKDHIYEFEGRDLSDLEKEHGEEVFSSTEETYNRAKKSKESLIPLIRCQVSGRVKTAFASFVGNKALHSNPQMSMQYGKFMNLYGYTPTLPSYPGESAFGEMIDQPNVESEVGEVLDDPSYYYALPVSYYGSWNYGLSYSEFIASDVSKTLETRIKEMSFFEMKSNLGTHWRHRELMNIKEEAVFKSEEKDDSTYLQDYFHVYLDDIEYSAGLKCGIATLALTPKYASKNFSPESYALFLEDPYSQMETNRPSMLVQNKIAGKVEVSGDYVTKYPNYGYRGYEKPVMAKDTKTYYLNIPRTMNKAECEKKDSDGNTGGSISSVGSSLLMTEGWRALEYFPSIDRDKIWPAYQYVGCTIGELKQVAEQNGSYLYEGQKVVGTSQVLPTTEAAYRLKSNKDSVISVSDSGTGPINSGAVGLKDFQGVKYDEPAYLKIKFEIKIDGTASNLGSN